MNVEIVTNFRLALDALQHHREQDAARRFLNLLTLLTTLLNDNPQAPTIQGQQRQQVEERGQQGQQEQQITGGRTQPQQEQLVQEHGRHQREGHEQGQQQAQQLSEIHTHMPPEYPSIRPVPLHIEYVNNNDNVNLSIAIHASEMSAIYGWYNQAFLVESLVQDDAESTFSINDLNHLNVLSIVCLYNAAFAFHLLGIKTERSLYFTRALQLYELLSRSIRETPLHSSTVRMLLAAHWHRMLIFFHYFHERRLANTERIMLLQLLQRHRECYKNMDLLHEMSFLIEILASGHAMIYSAAASA